MLVLTIWCVKSRETHCAARGRDRHRDARDGRHNLLGGGYDYRETVAPWFRGIFTLGPDPSLMSGALLVYQLHALGALALFALWPFTRLVHAFSIPVTYLRRPPILYRSSVRAAWPPLVPAPLGRRRLAASAPSKEVD